MTSKTPPNTYGIETNDALVLLNRMNKAINIAFRHNTVSDIEHCRWVIDQILRTLLAGSYRRIVHQVLDEDDGEWHAGIRPREGKQ